MTGRGTPSFLDHPEPYRAIRLRGLAEYQIDDDTGERYERDVWARPCPEGWTGWHSRNHMATQPRTVWPSGLWEEVKGGV